MDPSVTSLKRAGTFIRYRDLQYLYHEYFRVPSRSPDVEPSRDAASRAGRSFPRHLQGQRKSATLPHHPLFPSTEELNNLKELDSVCGCKDWSRKAVKTVKRKSHSKPNQASFLK